MSRFGKTAQPVVGEELAPPVKIDISDSDTSRGSIMNVSRVDVLSA
jgi:hypothetical protein